MKRQREIAQAGRAPAIVDQTVWNARKTALTYIIARSSPYAVERSARVTNSAIPGRVATPFCTPVMHVPGTDSARMDCYAPTKIGNVKAGSIDRIEVAITLARRADPKLLSSLIAHRPLDSPMTARIVFLPLTY